LSNHDVSSNDAGQDAAVFFGMSLLQSNFSPELAKGLLQLACLPIDIASPTSDSFLRIKFNSPYEPSGHSNTSVWNHLGSILLSLSSVYYMVHTEKPYSECVKLGAEQVGHVVTCDEVDCVEKIQFLKFSPVLCDGNYVMSANLGRIFRKLGCVDGDMTHDQLGVDLVEFRGLTPEERMNRFWSGVVEGLKHEPSNRVLEALRKRFSSSNYIVTESLLSSLQDENKDSYYMHNRTAKTGDCTESMMRRYDLTVEDVDELVDIILDLHVGQRWKLRSVANFYKTDYGLTGIVEGVGRDVDHIILEPPINRNPNVDVHRPVGRDNQQGNAEPEMNLAPDDQNTGIMTRMAINMCWSLLGALVAPSGGR
jgi:hypothetical protein